MDNVRVNKSVSKGRARNIKCKSQGIAPNVQYLTLVPDRHVFCWEEHIRVIRGLDMTNLALFRCPSTSSLSISQTEVLVNQDTTTYLFRARTSRMLSNRSFVRHHIFNQHSFNRSMHAWLLKESLICSRKCTSLPMYLGTYFIRS